ncbi:uncharacterized protein J4E87_004531 [Alternaria ethzedia]|uniref:uncharacterized protein n=1 Tax=Alternaria ethzedia TaxID=181014 RepID=UPI0020C2B82B|nr:uncharacterized protein J4E87_004531 [Alternaria ethzedia]KAI4627189.1 hypothetical protein J4E87_004531 [Alternaria ethzedia]
MSSVDPDNTHPEGEHSADTADLPIFGPPTAEELHKQLEAQVSEKDKQHHVFAAELAKIEQDYQAALANNADPSAVRHYEEVKQAHTAQGEQCLKELAELMQQCLCARRGATAYLKKNNQRLKAQVQRLKDEAKEWEAKHEEAKKKKEERARVEEEKKWWRSLTAEERKRIIQEWKAENIVLHQQNAVLEKKNAILTAKLKRIAVLRRKKAVRVVAQEALEIENEVVEARNKIEDAHIARWDGIFDWHDEALLRYWVYKMLEELGMRY